MSVVELAKQLIQYPSVTPASGEIFDYLEDLLVSLEFKCQRLKTETQDGVVENLFAMRGNKGKHFCFAGHVDVVPAGNIESWKVHPYKAQIVDNYLNGRGAVDMKGSIAAFLAALEAYIKENEFTHSLSLMITGDEEGPSIAGTLKIIDYMHKNSITPDFCLIGEPTSNKKIADTIKIGRRGSLTCQIKVEGIQGHIAYPHLARNPIHELTAYLNQIIQYQWDQGNEYFQPTNLEVISLMPANQIKNIIPETASAIFNIRFNTNWTKENLIAKLEQIAKNTLSKWNLESNTGSLPFLSGDETYNKLISDSIKEVLGYKPKLSTSGGTSDGRFIHKICPVVELGLLNETAHKVDEKVLISDLENLSHVYQEILRRFFGL